MPVIYIDEASAHVGQEVTIRGWLRSRRDKGKLHFLILRDGTGDLQAVVSKATVGEEQFARSAELTQESSLVVTGALRQDVRAPGGYELDVSRLDVLQVAEPFPIQPKEHGTGFLMEHRHLWLRSSRQHAVLRIRHEIIRACRNFFDTRGFTLVDAPIFTPNACEGTTTLFQTQYFDETAYLTQSGQLYSEATAAAFGKVYCFGPTFRAEKSKTRRHLRATAWRRLRASCGWQPRRGMTCRPRTCGSPLAATRSRGRFRVRRWWRWCSMRCLRGWWPPAG